MASHVFAGAAAELSMSRALQRAFDAVRHNMLLSVGLALALGAIPVVGFHLLMLRMDTSALVLTVAGRALPGAIALFLLGMFVGLAVGVIVQGAMVGLLFAQAEGRRATLRDAAGLFRTLPSLLALAIVTGLAVAIGMTLLIVPGVVVYLLWCIAPSAVVIEREGVFMALNRSQELTEGARWPVFGILLLLEAINMAAAAAVGFLGARVFGFTGAEANVAYVAMLVVLNTLSCLMWGTVQASLYVELVQWKDGGSAETLAEVFA